MALVFFLGLHSFSFSQTHTPRTVAVGPKCAGYYEYLPAGYASSTTKFPLIIYCGGAGTFGNGSTAALAKLLEEGVPYYIHNNQFPAAFTVNGQTSSFIVISPQFVGWPGPDDVESVLNYVLNTGYKVDQSRIYLTGFSAGGDATWKYPNTSVARSAKLAALVPVAGFNYPYVDTGARFMAQANLPVWALHSNDDGPALVSWSQNFVNKINSYNPLTPAIITRFNGIAHDPTKLFVYTPTYRPNGENVYEWMLRYSRNKAPVAQAGADQSVTLPLNTVTLNGSASTDPENSPLTYLWTKVGGPSLFTLVNNTTAQPVVSGLIAGVYRFELRVTDTSGNFDRDTVAITVINPGSNSLPQANAGPDETVMWPQNSVLLDATASADPGGAIELYNWTKISGPSSFSLSGSGAVINANGLRPGVYQFRLQVTDNENGTDTDTVQITVINPFPNQLPVARAGVNQTIVLPQNTITLNGSASTDEDGTITTYTWSQVAGPSSALLSNPSQVNTPVQNLQAGVYRFALVVRDDSLATDTDTMEVNVLAAPLVTTKFVRVNLFGGTNPYNQAGWNNWNVTGSTNITSSNFIYSDGSASAINAVLSYSQGVPDNGASYGGTMCPPEVLRYTTYATAGNRTVTIRGLNNALKYDIEFYASRSTTGNSTQFVINGVANTVVTDNNKTNKVVFTDITPSNGQILVTLNKIGTFTYLNGFILTEKSVLSGPNTPPVANAGNDISITLPANAVTLNGSASADPDGTIAGYSWAKIAGPGAFAITNPSQVSTSVTGLTAGVYQFELTVTDNSNAADKDTVQVTVNNAPPQVSSDSLNCGRVFTVVVIGSSTSYGTGATPIDSSWVNKYRSYVQSKNPLSRVINLGSPSMNTYYILCPTGFVPPVNRPAPDTNRNITKALSYRPDAIIINLPSNDIAVGYTQQESIDNYERAMALADSAGVPVWVTTTQPRSSLDPASRQKLIQFRDWTYQRFGNKAIDFWTTAATADGSIEALYNAGDGVHVNNNGHHLFYTRVLNERLLDSLCIRRNMPPVANAGSDLSVILPLDSVQLNSSASLDPDGSILSRLWTKIEGPSSFTISNPAAVSPVVRNLVAGVYAFALQVTDNYGISRMDTVLVTVNPPGPVAPVANAGADQLLQEPASSVSLNGNLSFDSDGTITGYNWTKISGPDSYSFNDSTLVNPLVSGLVTGVYQFALTVTDQQGLSDRDTVQVIINQLPDVYAGADNFITLPVNNVQLNGSAADADGSISSYSWSRLSGPAQFSFSSVAIPNPQFTNLVAGLYTLELRVTDNRGGVGRDTVQIRVYPPLNRPPLAAAGADMVITLPVNSVTVSGSSSSDPDNNINQYQWVQISGPSAATLQTPGTVSTVINGLVQGIYRFELTVTDDSAALDRDTVQVTVNPAATATNRFVRVNLFGGANPYNQDGWNNWNVTGTTNITSSNFNYSDGTGSSVNAVLSYSQGVPDNGANYGGTMCPPQVLRYTSYATAGYRYLTIRGLNNALKYDIEFYSSRGTTGNSTQFVINGVAKTVVTDNNKTEKVVFNDITPVNGQVVVTLNKIGTFTYLNGFTLTEKPAPQVRVMQSPEFVIQEIPAKDTKEVKEVSRPVVETNRVSGRK